MNNRMMNKIIFMVVFVVIGLSVPAFANIVDVTREGKNLADFEGVSATSVSEANNQRLLGLVDVSSEGKNPLNFESISVYRDKRVDSQIANIDDMRDTTSNYGIAPSWGNFGDKGSWYDSNVFGR